MSLAFTLPGSDASPDIASLLAVPSEERFDKLTRLLRRALGIALAAFEVQGSTALRCEPERWSQHPLPFHVRYPLHFEGARIGALCLGDYHARTLSAAERVLIQDVIELAEHELCAQCERATHARLTSLHEELLQRALVDGLTHVWNRGAIFDVCNTELIKARDAGESLALLMLDVDHFKHINDDYGHAGGDEVLRQLGKRLRTSVRPLDAVGRYGGEEFMIVLPNCSHASARVVAERLRSAVASAPVAFESHTIRVTASLGGVVTLQPGSTSDELAKLADQALYAAKRAGRNRVRMVVR